MFSCNSLYLLTFTYYLKLILAILMTIVPIFLLERIFIRIIQYKYKKHRLDKFIIKKEFKNFVYIIVIFTLAYTLHTALNKENNVCYMYASKDVIKEYRTIYYALKDEKINNNDKYAYLENILLTSYNDISNENTLNNNEKDDNNNQTTQIKKEIEDNFLKENDSTKLNNVYVQNGVFYYPKYVYGNRSTYSGTSCPSNPLKQGYNNPYGYNNYFYTRLTKFVEEASKNGYKITISTQGCRTYETQIYYYNTMTRGRAAYPGYSLHGFGIASDLEFYKSDGSVCPYGRTDYSCPSMGWAHKNAYKFGLTFPLLNASYKEDWHIEPINKSTY